MAAVETMRALLLADRRLGDATLVAVLAYAGLRPGELLALQWSDVRARTLLIERSLALGEVKDTKTRRARAVRLLAPLADDLAEWRRERGNPIGSVLVFPRRDGRAKRVASMRSSLHRVAGQPSRIRCRRQTGD